jgi:hypothetical protein
VQHGTPLGFFPGNIGGFSDEHGEWFHQNISRTERIYSGKWNPDLLADNCWTLVRETRTEEYNRQKTIKGVSDVTLIYF